MAAKYLTTHPRLIIALAATAVLLLVSFGLTAASPPAFHLGNFIPTGSPDGVINTKAVHLAATPTHQTTPEHTGASHADNSRHDDLLQHASNATLGFQKIFVINLASRYDHRDSMSLAAALSGLEVEYVDGVTEVARKYLPPGDDSPSDGSLAAYRAHMNVLRKIIEQNLTSALVMEDDVDWDVRIKSQMQDFARGSRLLLQPLEGTTDQFLDPSYPHPSEGQVPLDFDINKFNTTLPYTSPYGDVDRWDLLWLGHCGGRFAQPADEQTPLGRAIIPNDETVPEPQHIELQLGNRRLMDQYPAHTRVVSRGFGTVCTLAYGISQAGARRFFYELAVNRMDGPLDLLYRRLCDGLMDRKQRTCLSVQPQLFQHHRPIANKNTFSDITGHGNGMNKVAFTRNIRWSARLNFAKLVDDETDYVDLFKDGEAARTDLGFG